MEDMNDLMEHPQKFLVIFLISTKKITRFFNIFPVKLFILLMGYLTTSNFWSGKFDFMRGLGESIVDE